MFSNNCLLLPIEFSPIGKSCNRGILNQHASELIKHGGSFGYCWCYKHLPPLAMPSGIVNYRVD